jgi:arginine repressor
MQKGSQSQPEELKAQKCKKHKSSEIYAFPADRHKKSESSKSSKVQNSPKDTQKL